MNKSLEINIDWYGHNAEYYDLFDAKDIPYQAISKTLGKIFRQHNARTVIDLGCGTGNFYIPLALQGFAVTGIDISKEMLKIAKEKIIANKLKPKLKQSDIRDITSGVYDVAICLYNAIGDLNYQEFDVVIKNMKQLVKDNGLICFDVLNFENIQNFKFDDEFFIEKENINGNSKTTRFTKQILDRQNQILEISQYITINEKIDSNSISQCKMYLYTPNQVTNLLQKHGLNPILSYGSYHNKKGIIKFKPNDPMIGIVAQKIQ